MEELGFERSLGDSEAPDEWCSFCPLDAEPPSRPDFILLARVDKKKGGGALHGEPRGLNDFCPWHPHFPSPAKVTCPGLSEPVLAPRPSQSLTPDLCDTSRWVNGAPSPPERIKSPRPPLASYDRGLSLSALLKRYPSTRPRASQPPAQLTFEFSEIRLAPPPPRSALHTPAPPELFWRKVAGGKLQLVKSL